MPIPTRWRRSVSPTNVCCESWSSSPDKCNALRRLYRPQMAKTTLPQRNSNTSTLLEKQMEKEKLSKPRRIILTNPLEIIAIRRGMVGTTEAMGPFLISRKQGSGHGSRGSRTSNKSSDTPPPPTIGMCVGHSIEIPSRFL